MLELFLKPIFEQMGVFAKQGTLLDQIRVLELVENAGAAHPEAVLDVLTALRLNPKEDIKKIVPIWGEKTFSPCGHHPCEIALGYLFQLSEQCVSDQLTAIKVFENEFLAL